MFMDIKILLENPLNFSSLGSMKGSNQVNPVLTQFVEVKGKILQFYETVF